MAKINPRVVAAVDLARARAADGLARLEAAERGSSTIGGSTASQISRQRAIKELRDQVKSWTWLLAVVRHEDRVVVFNQAVELVIGDVDAEKEFPA